MIKATLNMRTRNGSTRSNKEITLILPPLSQGGTVPPSPAQFELSYLKTWTAAADLEVSHTTFIAKARIILKDKNIFFYSDEHFSNPKFIRDQ